MGTKQLLTDSHDPLECRAGFLVPPFSGIHYAKMHEHFAGDIVLLAERPLTHVEGTLQVWACLVPATLQPECRA